MSDPVQSQSQNPETTTPDPALETKPATSLVTEAPAPEVAAFDEEKLTIPEGFEKGGDEFKQFTELAKEAGFKHPTAEKLLGIAAAVMKANTAKLYEAWEKQNLDWQKEVKEDAKIGGQKLEEVRQTIAKVLDNPELSDPKFREALDFTGAGNHPAVIRTLHNWAKALTEGASVAGNPPARDAQGRTVTTTPSIAEAFYGPNGPQSGGPKF